MFVILAVSSHFHLYLLHLDMSSSFTGDFMTGITCLQELERELLAINIRTTISKHVQYFFILWLSLQFQAWKKRPHLFFFQWQIVTFAESHLTTLGWSIKTEFLGTKVLKDSRRKVTVCHWKKNKCQPLKSYVRGIDRKNHVSISLLNSQWDFSKIKEKSKMTTKTADSLNGTWKMKSPQIDRDIQCSRNTNICRQIISEPAWLYSTITWML